MTTRLAADGQPVQPEAVRAMIQRGRDRRAEVEQARTPHDGIPAGQWTDGDVLGGLFLLLTALGAVFTMIGLIDAVIFCCQHWRGAAQGLFIAFCGGFLLVMLRLTRDVL